MGQTGGFSQIKNDDWPDLNNTLRRIFERLDGVEGRRGSTVRGADLNMGGFKGINADDPTDDGDLVTKGYADDHYGPTNIALQLAFGGSNPLNINQLIGRSAEPQIPAFTNFTTLPPVTLYQPDSTIVVNGVVYRLDGSTDPARWVAVNSPGLSGTHAARLTSAATGYAIGSSWWETDRTVTYLVQTVSAVNTWIYADGVMVNTLANRPVDLGTNDERFRFLATDTAQHFRWTGTAWVEEQEISNAVTAAVTTLFNLIHRSTGTPAANFGAALAFLLDSSTNVLRNAGYLDFIWTTATNGSESAALVVKLMAAGAAAAEVLRVNGDGTASLVGDLSVPAEVYGAGWDGSNEATTKNDVYDKMEAVVASIAALTQIGYILPFYCPAFSPVDATNYHIGSLYTFAPATAGGGRRVFIPKAGTIKAVYVSFIQTTLAGTGETSTVYVRLNNTTDTVISAAVNNDATDEIFSNVGLSIAVVQGDFFEIKWTTPTWVTNPTGVIVSGNVYIE